MNARIAAIIVDHHVAGVDAAVRSVLPLANVQEIHVVDNGGSTAWPELRAASEGWGVRLVEHSFRSNTGFGAGVNRAAKTTDLGYLLLLNPDARVIRWDTTRSIRAMREAHAGALGPNIVSPDGRPEPSAGERQSVVDLMRRAAGRRSRVKRPLILDPDDVLEVGWVSAAAMLIDRDAFDEVGGFDERYFLYYEDMDLCRWLARAGWSTLRAGHGNVVHEMGGARQSAWSQRGIIATSLWRYLRDG